jgi:subtilase family serine protease
VAQVSGRPNRISLETPAKPIVELSGSVHPLTAKATDLGAVNSNLSLNSLTLNIGPSAQQKQEIAALLGQLQNPKSAQYHKWLTQAEYGARFGLTEADLGQLTSWLNSQGFTVRNVSKSRNAIVFSGKVWQVESAFHTQLHQYRLKDENHFANATPLHIPGQFAGVVLDVRGLDDFRPKASVRRIPVTPAFYGSDGANYLSPGDWATIYNLTGVYGAGFDGTGTHIGVVGQTYAPQADIDSFRTAAGLPATKLTYACISAADCTDAAGVNPGDLAEADLDIEWTGGIASNATVDYIYAAGDDPSLGVFDALQYAIESYTTAGGSVVPVISMSYTTCEAQFPGALIPVIDAAGQQASLQGQTLVAASGDSGAAGCDADGDPTVTVAGGGLSVVVPADSPNFTAVGGTTLSGDESDPTPYWLAQTGLVNSAIQYIPETPWNETGTGGLAASGGGESTAFPQPAWQSGLIANSTGRLVPDVAFAAAAAHDGYLICSADFNSTVNGTMCSNGFYSSGGTGSAAFYAAGGTSASTPSFAGMLALMVQRYGPLGNVNPALYAMATDPPTYAAAFQDIVQGDTNEPCVSGTTGCNNGLIGFSATTGYDQATGLGSVNGNGLLTALAGFYNQAGTTAVLTAAPNPVVLGQTVTLTAAVSSLAGVASPVTGTVTFTTAAATLGSAPVVGGVATLNVTTTTANGLGLGSDTVIASYGGDVNYVASVGSTALTVSTPLSSVIVVAGGPVAAGGTVTLTATVSALFPQIPTGTVTFTTGSAILGSASLVAGVATLSNVPATAANGLGFGEDLVTASYSGDANFLPESGSFGLLVYDPRLPLLASLSSASATAGSAGFALTVTGANFTPGSLVLWNGSIRTTTYVSSSQLAAAISAADIANQTTANVTVANLSPNPGTSSALPFVVMSGTPVAAITGDSIAVAADSSGNHLLTISGMDFVPLSTVLWNGGALSTTYLSPGILSATITSTDYTTRPATVTVSNPAGTSAGYSLQ